MNLTLYIRKELVNDLRDYAKDENHEGHTMGGLINQLLAEHFAKGESITCPNCQMVSYNLKDVENKYCGNCHEYHVFMVAE
jgi:protein-arginine kinase activator protein McsA